MKINRVVYLPDIHIPFEDKITLAAVEQYLEDTQPDEIIIGGDFMDFNCISSHNEKNLRAVEGTTIAKDVAYGNAVLDRWQARLNGKFTYLEGNHEFRLNRYVDANPRLEGSLEIPTLLHLDKRGIKWVPSWSKGKTYNIGKATFLHGESTADTHAKGMVSAYGDNVFYGHCFDDTTEILTPRGWKNHVDIALNTLVMTMNKETRAFEYQPIKAINRYWTTEPMRCLGGQNVDLLVTGKHGLVDVKAKSLDLYTADEYEEKCVRTFQCAGVQARQDLPLSDDEIRLVVWIAADGSIENEQQSGVRFHLRKTRKLERLKALLTRLDITFSEKPQKSGTTKIYFSKTATGIWDLFARRVKSLPPSFAYASPRQAAIILEEYVATDGNKTGPNSYQISTSKECEADILQMLFVTSGIRCNKTQRKSSQAWVLSANTNHTQSEIRTLGGIGIITSDKERLVWCPTVTNGTLLIRRNGKVCVTQNTHDIQSYSKKTKGDNKTRIGQSLGCLCSYEQAYMRGTTSRWQQGFGVFHFLPDGFFNHYVVSVFKHRFISPEGWEYDGKELLRRVA